MWRYVLFILILLFPLKSFAAVTINEVAWMGSATSANDEWIELYNDGVATDVTDWVLSDGMSLDIVLSGTIAANSYAVLERTDDTSAPGTAFVIYTGALTNSGATLTLYRTDGSIEDVVAGGDNWANIGGDNTTKDTAQYTSAGWVTDVATPGADNNPGRTATPEVVAPASESSGSGKLATPIPDYVQPLYIDPRAPTLTIHVPTQSYVNQPVSMDGSAAGLSDPLLASLDYQWNFGDLGTSSGKTVTHQFAYPGEYVVTARISYKAYQANARSTITILPETLVLTLSKQGDIQVHNAAKYDVDVSGFTVTAGTQVVFPPGTWLLPNATLTIPRERLAYTGQVIGVFDPGKQLVVQYPDITTPTATKEAVAVVRMSSPTRAITSPSLDTVGATPGGFASDTPNFSFVSSTSEPVPVTASAVSVAIASTTDLQGGGQAAAAPLALEAAPPLETANYPILGLIAVIIIGLLALVAKTAHAPTVPPSEQSTTPTKPKSSPFFD